MSNYYVLGTKYTDPNNEGNLYSEDILPYCIHKNVAAIGFTWDTDLTNFYNKNPNELKQLLRSQGEKGSTIAQMQRFMQLCPGDIIALKGTGAPIRNKARLDIVGYAVVIEKNNVVYRHDCEEFPQGLGHIINVEFLELGIKRTLEMGYGRSIHHITNPEIITEIFGNYYTAAETANQINEIYKTRNIEEKLIEVSAIYLKTTSHNKIQQSLYDKLILTYGIGNVKMEEDFVDLVIKTKEKIILIEVKPFSTARQCIIEGLGQLLNYYERSNYDKAKLEVMIVGDNIADIDDIEFVNFIKTSLHIPFDYKGWTEL